MAKEVVMPRLAAGMEIAPVTKWLKREGESVVKGEPLFEVESDKVVTEVEAPVDGVVARLVVAEGTDVEVGTVVAIIAEPGESVATTASASSAAPAVSQPAGSTAAATGNGRDGGAAVAVATPPVTAQPTTPSGRIFSSPRARLVAREKGIDLSLVRGTGPGGRIMEKDVLRAAAELAAGAVAAAAGAAAAASLAPAPAAPELPAADGWRDIPLAGVRRVIADRMSRSRQTAADVVLTVEVDMGEAAKLRAQGNAEWEKVHGLRMTYTDIIVKAVARALIEHPRMNAALVDGQIREYQSVHVGVAVALEEGLIVPVIRNADRKSLLEIARNLRDLGDRARRNALNRDEVTGSTFTITNMGMYGTEIFTPVINPPECAILGVGQIAERAVVREGTVVIRPTMWLSLSFDHRITDGVPAARFLSRVKQLLESPFLLFV